MRLQTSTPPLFEVIWETRKATTTAANASSKGLAITLLYFGGCGVAFTSGILGFNVQRSSVELRDMNLSAPYLYIDKGSLNDVHMMRVRRREECLDSFNYDSSGSSIVLTLLRLN